MQAELSDLTQLGLLQSPSLDTITEHIDPAWIEQALGPAVTLGADEQLAQASSQH